MPSTSIQPILDAAFADYVKQTGIDLAMHPFADQLQICHSPDDVLKLLEEKTNEFKDYREGNRKLIDCLKPVVNVINAFSGVLGEAVRLVSLIASCFLFTCSPVCCYQVPFQPAGAIFAGVDILLAVRVRHSMTTRSTISGCYRQPAVSARATMRSLTCSTASEISSNAFESTPVSR
jgi:hypothetical protein